MSAAKKLGEARLGMLAPGQRVPALRHHCGSLFSFASRSSLPEPVSNIGRFIETADAPGNGRFSSARLPSILSTSARTAALCPSPHVHPFRHADTSMPASMVLVP
jgi:hypothetical protein